MKRSLALLAVLVGVVLAGVLPGAAVADPGIGVDRNQVNATLGDTFSIRTEITNPGTTRTEPYLAHLNVASLTHDVYVDPEDWSDSRSKDVGPLEPGARTTVTWQIQAVNPGSFDAYVVLLPNGATTGGRGQLVVSPSVHLKIATRRTFSAGGALPVSIAVPVLLGLVVLGLRARTRRSG